MTLGFVPHNQYVVVELFAEIAKPSKSGSSEQKITNILVQNIINKREMFLDM